MNSAMLTDAELLCRFAAKADEEAFTELVHRHLGLVYNAALRRANGNAHLAEEAAQIVFTQLSGKARALSRHTALLGWLHTSTRYATNVLIRAEQRRAARESAAFAMNSASEEHNAIPWETLRPLIDESLDRLNAPDREAVLLRFFAGKSYAAVAAELGVSEDGARKRVDRAIERLRRLFARRGVTTSASALALALTHAPAMAVPEGLAGTVVVTAKVAVAAAAGGGAATALGFMSTIKTSSLALVACSVLGLATFGTALVKWSRQQREEIQIEAMHREAAMIRARIVQHAQAGGARRPAEKSVAATNPPPVATARSQAQESYRSWKKMRDSVEYAPFRAQMFRLRAQREFGTFFATHAFPAAKVEALRHALTTYYDAEEAAVVQSYVAPAAEGAKQVRDGMEQAKHDLFASLSVDFTEPEMADIKRCFEAQARMGSAREVSYELAYGNEPMNRTQELALAAVLADASRMSDAASSAERKRMQAVDAQTGLSLADHSKLDDAAAFLTPTQLKLYRDFLRQQQVDSTLKARARAQVEETTPHS